MNGVITGYTYSFIEGGRTKPPVLDETTDTTVSFEDLTPYTDYTFTISANTDAGIGVGSTLVYPIPVGGTVRFCTFILNHELSRKGYNISDISFAKSGDSLSHNQRFSVHKSVIVFLYL